MCKPTTSEVRRVVIAGAGPAGLLLQALLHNRNKQSPDDANNVIYDITLIESRPDLGLLDPETELPSYRSWMIGLSGHGLEAVRSAPGLYDEYLKDIGVEINEGHIFIGKKKMSFSSNDDDVQENFIVDRNYIVAALARYAQDKLRDSPYYRSLYETELLYVDSSTRRILTRNKNTHHEQYIPYDLLIGADGVRSTVREALVKRHFDFELEVTDIFNTFKAVHVQRPESISPTSLSLLPAGLPNMNGICLPEPGNMVNISFGVSRNLFDDLPPELKLEKSKKEEKDSDQCSNDEMSEDDKIKAVAKYFKENLKAFELTEEGYIDFATQWVNQRWNRTGMVHCNRYHSVECGIVLMGDAAHATSPSIGMGMNTALRDAQKFNELLDSHNHDLSKVLPQYSKDRVPEGNALSDLALHLYCFDNSVYLKTMIGGIIRSTLHKFFPSLIGGSPNDYLGRAQYTLGEIYRVSSEQGVIPKHRAINDKIRQEYFEKEIGLKKDEKATWHLFGKAGIATLVGVIAVGVACSSNQN